MKTQSSFTRRQTVAQANRARKAQATTIKRQQELIEVLQADLDCCWDDLNMVNKRVSDLINTSNKPGGKSIKEWNDIMWNDLYSWAKKEDKKKLELIK